MGTAQKKTCDNLNILKEYWSINVWRWLNKKSKPSERAEKKFFLKTSRTKMAISDLLQLSWEKKRFAIIAVTQILQFTYMKFQQFFFPALSEGSDFLSSHRQTFIDQYSLKISKLSRVFFTLCPSLQTRDRIESS